MPENASTRRFGNANPGSSVACSTGRPGGRAAHAPAASSPISTAARHRAAAALTGSRSGPAGTSQSSCCAPNHPKVSATTLWHVCEPLHANRGLVAAPAFRNRFARSGPTRARARSPRRSRPVVHRSARAPRTHEIAVLLCLDPDRLGRAPRRPQPTRRRTTRARCSTPRSPSRPRAATATSNATPEPCSNGSSSSTTRLPDPSETRIAALASPKVPRGGQPRRGRAGSDHQVLHARRGRMHAPKCRSSRARVRWCTPKSLATTASDAPCS